MTAAKRIPSGNERTNTVGRSSSSLSARRDERSISRNNSYITAGTVKPRKSEIDFIRVQGQKLAAMKSK